MKRYLKELIKEGQIKEKIAFNNGLPSTKESNKLFNESTQYSFNHINEEANQVEAEIERQRILYEKKLEEQKQNYYTQIEKWKESTNKYIETIEENKHESNSNEPIEKSFSKCTSNLSLTSNYKQDSEYSKKEKCEKNNDKQFSVNQITSSNLSDYYLFESDMKLNNKISTCNCEEDFDHSGAYESKFGSFSTANNESPLNFAKYKGDIWEVPDSKKIYNKKDLITGFNFDCEACKYDPFYRCEKQLKF